MRRSAGTIHRVRSLPLATLALAVLAAPGALRADDAGALGARAVDAAWRGACGAPDAALAAVAARVASGAIAVEDPDALAVAVRDAGASVVRPRAWTVSGRDLGADEVRARLSAWAARTGEPGEARCGVFG